MPFLLLSKDAFAINDVVNSLKQWSKQQIDRIFTENVEKKLLHILIMLLRRFYVPFKIYLVIMIKDGVCLIGWKQAQ